VESTPSPISTNRLGIDLLTNVLYSFSAAGSEYVKLVYDNAKILFTMAIADNVLSNIKLSRANAR
jgi:hypothetical protein